MARGGDKAKSSRPSKPTWVIDTHGLKAALESRSNALRNAIIGAIECGQMWLLKPVSHELKEAYEDLYRQLQSFAHKKYLPITVRDQHTAAVLMEQYGVPLLGGQPSVSYFEAVAAANENDCILVTAGKSLRHCGQIVRKCHLGQHRVISVEEII